MPSINPNTFGTIEDLSLVYCAYENWEATRITPFSDKDIIYSAKIGKTEARSFQDPSVQAELNQYFQDLNNSGISHEEKDKKLSEWARNFHIERTAYLYNQYPNNQINVTPDIKITDGLHRVMAAIALGKNAIEYNIVY